VVNNLVNLNKYRKNKDKYILFLFSEEMPLTIDPTHSLWYIEPKNKDYYELYNGRWLLNNDYYRFETYKRQASDIIEAFELVKLKSVLDPDIYKEAINATFDECN